MSIFRNIISESSQIAKNIRKIRELRGYSQEFVATQLEMSQRQYHRLESGESDFSLKKLEIICRVLEVSLFQLLGFDAKYILQNSSNSGIGNTVTVHNTIPEQLINLYNERIKHLEEEVVFLRSKLP